MYLFLFENNNLPDVGTALEPTLETRTCDLYFKVNAEKSLTKTTSAFERLRCKNDCSMCLWVTAGHSSPRTSLDGQIGHVLLLVVMLSHVLSRVRHRAVGQQLVLRRLVLLLVMSHVGRPVVVMVPVVMWVNGYGHVTAVVHGGAVAVAVVAAWHRLLAGHVRCTRTRFAVFHQNRHGHSSRRTLSLWTNKPDQVFVNRVHASSRF